MKNSSPSRTPQFENNSTALQQAAMRRLPRRVTSTGEVAFPAAPALLDHSISVLTTVFASLGRTLSPDESGALREIMAKYLREGFEQSPYAKVIVSYETDPLPKTSLTYHVHVSVSTMAEQYEEWVRTREPPLFGANPDAKVMDLATKLGVPGDNPVIDIGAGTGRNTLPLARAGFPTDAVEMSPALAEILKRDAAAENLGVGVFEGDVLDPQFELPKGRYKLAILAEVFSHFRRIEDARRIFERAAEFLAPRGLLLFSVFLSKDGYKPDALARELSEVFWCTAFTRRELADALKGLPFDRISDEAVCDFEQAHLPEHAWPPTGWFVEWTRGQDLYDLPAEKCPLDLRWVVYRRR
jgi:SAM-dependent methyltransferase